MATMLELDPALVAAAEARARAEGTTLDAKVEAFLRELVRVEPARVPPRELPPLPVFRLGQPRYRIGSLGQVLELLDQLEAGEEPAKDA